LWRGNERRVMGRERERQRRKGARGLEREYKIEKAGEVKRAGGREGRGVRGKETTVRSTY